MSTSAEVVMTKQTGIFECKPRGDGEPHLFNKIDECEFCGIDASIVEAEFDKAEVDDGF